MSLVTQLLKKKKRKKENWPDLEESRLTNCFMYVLYDSGKNPRYISRSNESKIKFISEFHNYDIKS